MLVLNAVLIGVALYAVAGVLFAVVFVTRGVSRVDSAAEGAPLGFRLIVFPGSAALWPLLLWRWARSGQGRHG